MVMGSSLRTTAEGGHVEMVMAKENEGGKADVEGMVVHTGKEIPRIPQSQRFCNFEE